MAMDLSLQCPCFRRGNHGHAVILATERKGLPGASIVLTIFPSGRLVRLGASPRRFHTVGLWSSRRWQCFHFMEQSNHCNYLVHIWTLLDCLLCMDILAVIRHVSWTARNFSCQDCSYEARRPSNPVSHLDGVSRAFADLFKV